MEYNIGDKVFVKDWGKYYSTIFKWINQEKTTIFNWTYKIPNEWWINPDHHWHRKWEPKLTKKGVPYKNKDKILVHEYPKYKDYEYTILEVTNHPDTNTLIYLLKSDNDCFVQIGEGGIDTLTPEEQKTLSLLAKENSIKVLIKDNLGKWSITDDLKTFPKELLKYLYDKDQRTQFGSGFTKAIIKYPYIDKMYTKKGNDLLLGWEQTYNGKGCDLSDKETIAWKDLSKRFPENKFKG